MASLQSTTVNGILTVNLSSGTMISSSAMTDMIGWNASYGSYIGSTVGSTTYIYGNGSFYDGSANRTLLHSANVGTYAFPRSGSWAADLVSSYGFTREHGMQMTGGSEFVVLSKSGQGYLLVDGSYYAAEAGGFYSTNNSSGGTLLGFYADTTTSLNFNTATVKLNSNQILHAGNYGGYSTFTGNVTWDGYNNGNARSVRIGYSGGNYGAIGYGINFTATTNTHTYAINDNVTRVDLYDGIIVYGAAGGTVGTNVTWTTLLSAHRGNTSLQWKGNNVLDASNYAGYSAFSGSVTSGYGSFSSPGYIVGDAQYGLYVTGGNLYYKSASGGVHYWRNTANSGNPMALDNNGNLTITGALSEGGYTAYPDRVYTINLSAQSTAVFYPVVLDASPGEGTPGVWHHRFSVEMPSLGGGVNFNNHTLVAEVRGQGWSDQQLFYRAFHTYYDTGERSILGIWRGTQSWYGVVVYLRGGQTYYVRSNSRSVTGYTSAVTLNSSATFALKDYTNADVSGTSANISEMLNLFNTAAGFYHSNIIIAPSMYAARFYDNDNSTYYLDPASTSNLNGLTVAGTITGSITGNAGTVTVTAGATNGAWYPIVWHDGNTLKSTSNVRIWAQNGYIESAYLQTTDDVSTSNISHIVAKFGDNYHRSATAAKVAGFISGQNMNIVGNATTVTNGVYTNANNTLTGVNVIQNTANTFVNTVATANQALTLLQGTAGADAYITFHVSGDYAGYFGLGGAENDLVWGGWSVGNNRYRILHSGNQSYAWALNQLLRTTDSPTFSGLTLTSLTTPGLHAQWTLSGGGTVTWNGSSILWSNRIIAIPIENTEFGANGYIDINCPTSGTVTYYNSSNVTTTVTCTGSGIPLNVWEAVYYEVTPGQANTSDQTKFRVVNYQNSTWKPNSNWLLICARNGDSTDGHVKWIPGQINFPNSSGIYYSGTGLNNWESNGTTNYVSKFTGANVLGNSLIQDNGTNVGIGTSPAYKLDVNGACHASSFPTSSDARFKKNIKPIQNSLDKINKINGVVYEWNEFVHARRDGYELNTPIIGVIAQDLEKVLPEVVSKWSLSEDCPDARAVDYIRIIPVLVEAIKELNNKNSILEARILALENKQ